MTEITIRPIRADDAPAFLNLLRALDDETRFMMLEPGERTLTVEEQHRRLESILASGNQMIFVAEPADGAGLVGFVSGSGGAYRRNRRTVHIVAGVRAAYAGHGLGTRLFAALETWARGWGARRLELTVMCHNERALRLYQKVGFTIEGRLRASLQVDGSDVDEYIMSKIIEESHESQTAQQPAD